MFKFVKGVFCILLGVLVLPTLANDPGNAAIAFLEKVRLGEVDLESATDTALKAQTSEGKRDVIAESLERLAIQIGGSKLELGEVRRDGDYAAVMIHQGTVFDKSEIRVFPVAVIKEKGGWIAAPVLASFENAVLNYTVSGRKKLARLEAWMMRQRVLELEELAGSAERRARAMITNALPPDQLKQGDLVALIEELRDACFERNQAKFLALLGGFSEPWPEDWDARLATSQFAVSKNNRDDYPWRLLVSPQVVRVPIEVEKTAEEGFVSIACLDPALSAGDASAKGIHILNFRFKKSESGFWRIELPSALTNSSDGAPVLLDADLDSHLLKKFGQALLEAEPFVAVDTALGAERNLIKVLKTGTLSKLLRSLNFSGISDEFNSSCIAAAEIWWEMNNPAVFRSPVRLGFREEGEVAIAAYQWFSVNRVDRFEMKLLAFKKTDTGWVWVPELELDTKDASHEQIVDWLSEKEDFWSENWRDILVEPSVKLEQLDLNEKVTDDDGLKLVGEWIRALKEGDIEEALSVVVWIGGKRGLPVKTLRNLAYEIEGAGTGRSEITGIYQSESWAAAGLKRLKEDRVSHQFIPIIQTQEGPRILLEIDLFVGSERTREFLNEASFEHLAPGVSKEQLTELKELFESFKNGIAEE